MILRDRTGEASPVALSAAYGVPSLTLIGSLPPQEAGAEVPP